jgi:hypothetical protein
VPGDRKPSKRRSRPERERIEYAPDALGWLREQLEPPVVARRRREYQMKTPTSASSTTAAATTAM